MLYFKNKSRVIHIRISSSEFSLLKSYSDKYNIPISSIVRQLIKPFLARYEHK